MPTELKALAVHKGRLFKTASFAYRLLFLTKENEDEIRAKLAKIILETRKELNIIWKELDFFQANKKILGEHFIFKNIEIKKQIEDLNDFELLKIIKNRPSDILKYKNERIPKAKDQFTKEKLLNKVQIWENELKNARELLKKRENEKQTTYRNK